MKRLGLLFAVSLSLFAPAAVAQEPTVRPAPALEELRAGAAAPATLAPDASERAAIAAASSPALEHLRAQDLSLSDREVKIALVVAAAVIILAILI